MLSKEICGLHCPKGMLWLWTAFAAWFTLGAFGIPTYGAFWSWVVLLTGLCTYVCASDPKHAKTSCPFTTLSPGFGILLALVGIWFVLGDESVLPTYGINLLYLVLFLFGAEIARRK